MRIFPGFLWAALVLSAGGAGLSSCGSSATSQPAASPVHGVQEQSQDQQIRTAIQQHLTHVSNLNVQSFDTDVTAVQVQGDHAQARVEFKVKGGQGAMDFAYQLERRDGNWAVTQSNPIGGHTDAAH